MCQVSDLHVLYGDKYYYLLSCMPSSVCLTFIISCGLHKKYNTWGMVPILQVGKLRPKGVKEVIQDHTAGKGIWAYFCLTANYSSFKFTNYWALLIIAHFSLRHSYKQEKAPQIKIALLKLKKLHSKIKLWLAFVRIESQFYIRLNEIDIVPWPKCRDY